MLDKTAWQTATFMAVVGTAGFLLSPESPIKDAIPAASCLMSLPLYIAEKYSPYLRAKYFYEKVLGFNS